VTELHEAQNVHHASRVHPTSYFNIIIILLWQPRERSGWGDTVCEIWYGDRA